MTETPEQIDRVETLLTHLLYAGDTTTTHVDGSKQWASGGAEYKEVDATVRLDFAPMLPALAYTFEHSINDEDNRLYTMDPSMLLALPQDILGARAEIAIVAQDCVKWSGFRRLHKRPRNVWVGAAGACLYEHHYREIRADGASTYTWRVAAITRKGSPVVSLVEGTTGSGSILDSQQLVLAASIIEDAHRPNALTATISERAAIRMPVPVGEHRELFALRDGPLNASGRRRAILHWVRSHLRQTKKRDAEVSAHWRGVRELKVDGFSVRLEPNGGNDE